MRNVNLSKLINYNIQEKDKWILYQLENINCWTDSTKKQTAYCYSKDGNLNIFISHDIIREGKQLLTETIKHEIYHAYYGHLNGMLHKNKAQRQLLNILYDCSIHQGPVNHSIFTKHNMNPCTYASCDLPILPPHVLYDKMKDNISQSFILNHLNDNLWEQSPISDVEQSVLQNSIEQALDKAEEEGHALPNGLEGGTSKGKGREGFEMDIVKNPKWLKELIHTIKNYGQDYKHKSWHREPRQEIGGGIMKRGLTNGKSKTRFLFAIDCSASMSTQDIRICVSAIHSASVREGLQGEALFFDTHVDKKVDIRDTESILKQVELYGGGTEFNCVLQYASPNDILVFWTDGGAWDLHQLNTDKFIHKPTFVLTTDWKQKWYSKLGKVITVPKEDLTDWR